MKGAVQFSEPISSNDNFHRSQPKKKPIPIKERPSVLTEDPINLGPITTEISDRDLAKAVAGVLAKGVKSEEVGPKEAKKESTMSMPREEMDAKMAAVDAKNEAVEARIERSLGSISGDIKVMSAKVDGQLEGMRGEITGMRGAIKALPTMWTVVAFFIATFIAIIGVFVAILGLPKYSSMHIWDLVISPF